MGKNRGNEFYTKKAKKEGYLARSIYKLEEIDVKYDIFGGECTSILDIGCAPGSWLQYASKIVSSRQNAGVILGFDLKRVTVSLPHVFTYQIDITDRTLVQGVLDEKNIEKFSCIISDMAPDTIGMSDIDALRSIVLIEKTLWLYDKYLEEDGKFVIKVFMGPGFDDLVRELKQKYGASAIVTYKPKSCRKASKEIFIIKRK